MSIDADYLELLDRIVESLPPVEVTGLYLPDLIEDGSYRDEFGFVFLSDGSVGPFYVSLKPVLATLRQRFPERKRPPMEAADLARRLAGGDLAERALALGAFNALSHRLMRRAGYWPPDRGAAKEVPPRDAGKPIGIVGYFCPVIDRLVESGNQVLVLEQQPERVPERANVRLTTSPADLAGCEQVLCTASVLINDTLDDLLAVCAHGVRFQLIGPTGSGLPDALFARGLESVGGILFDDPLLLEQVLARRESWGSAGRKYEIQADDYPGVERLIADFER
jgi:uncharacterized protein (DUF4213/DUF364 family)